jgi:hypothetical protein
MPEDSRAGPGADTPSEQESPAVPGGTVVQAQPAKATFSVPQASINLGAIERPGGEVDLTGEVAALGGQQLGVERRLWAEELARISLAGSFVLIFAGTVIWACWASVAAGEPGWTNAKDLLSILLPAETTLLGGAVAFYFATREKK